MNLLYLVAMGAAEPRFIQAVSWCVTSARRFGKFAGDIVVLTDREPDAFTAEVREQVRIVPVDERRLRDGHRRSATHRYQIARLELPSLVDVGGYQAVMYLDADVLCMRDIRPLFECGPDFRYSCEFQPMSAPMYSGCLSEDEIAAARWRRGVNSGVFVAPADYLAGCFGVWREILDGRPDAQAYDQPALNAAVLRKLIRARPLPYFAVAYPVLGNFAFHLREQTSLLHYCGLAEKKFARMRLHYEYLCAGGPVRVDFGDAVPPPAPPAWTSPVAGKRYAIAVNDSFRAVEAFSITNAAWRRELTARGHRVQDLSLVSADRLDFVIHHNYAVDFAEPLPESSGKHIAVRTSDLGPYPPAWVDLINRSYDQLWVRSRWIHALALESGIDPERLRLIPNGFDPEVLRPEGPTADLPTARRFRFLFVGGAVARKGFDVLLRAYTAAFAPDDDVALIVKDAGAANRFYDDRPFRDEIRRIQSDPSAPELLYIDDHLPPRELAALYRSCDCAVFPYRAEGFVIPALEALACGRPTIVPDIGPSTDYSNAATSFLVPALHIRLPVGRSFRTKIGRDLDVGEVDFCEVKATSLMTAMRQAYECGAAERRAMGLAGAQLVHGAFTWKHVADRIETQLRELDDGRSPVRHRPTFSALRTVR